MKVGRFFCVKLNKSIVGAYGTCFIGCSVELCICEFHRKPIFDGGVQHKRSVASSVL